MISMMGKQKLTIKLWLVRSRFMQPSNIVHLPDTDGHVGRTTRIAIVHEIVWVKRWHRIGSGNGWASVSVVAAAAISFVWRQWLRISTDTLEIVIDTFAVVIVAVVHRIRWLDIVLSAHLTFLVVTFAQNFIITQIESVANAKSAGKKNQK